MREPKHNAGGIWGGIAGGGPGLRRGAVLVGLLWCLALLTVLVLGMLHATQSDLRLARFHADRIQARHLAWAGIERAKALLYQDARERSRSGLSHNGQLFDAPQHFRDIPLGRGTFRVMRGARPGEGGGVVFGVDDEESRLNLNTAEPEDLGKIEGMTPDLPPAIVDWRDADEQVTPNGAEAEHYLALNPPYLPRNGPFFSVRELLLVRGIEPRLLFGDEDSDSGVPGFEEDADPGLAGVGGAASTLPEGRASVPGWARLLTVHSGVNNVSATGQERINVQTASETELTGVNGITADIARAIVAHRGQNRLESLADLLEVRPAPPPGQPGGPGPDQPGVPGGGPPGEIRTTRGGPGNTGGAPVIDSRRLIDIADFLTTGSETLEPGLINVNTAPVEVLMCLPGVSRELAYAIVNHRGSAGYFANIAALLNVPGMTTEIFKQLGRRITARSETFRILAEGRVRSTGVRQRVQAVVRVGTTDVETLAYRENDL